MTLMRWGRLLLITGLALTVGSALPALILSVLPPVFSVGFFGLVAAMLTLSLTPFGALVTVVGLILAGIALLRRGGA